ncbi:hypothetical protein ECG_03124 [Echinococcus granulosus]|nr:hypothetical protein ECG_03124 [Echinococcus granulosus]
MRDEVGTTHSQIIHCHKPTTPSCLQAKPMDRREDECGLCRRTHVSITRLVVPSASPQLATAIVLLRWEGEAGTTVESTVKLAFNWCKHLSQPNLVHHLTQLKPIKSLDVMQFLRLTCECGYLQVERTAQSQEQAMNRRKDLFDCFEGHTLLCKALSAVLILFSLAIITTGAVLVIVNTNQTLDSDDVFEHWDEHNKLIPHLPFQFPSLAVHSYNAGKRISLETLLMSVASATNFVGVADLISKRNGAGIGLLVVGLCILLCFILPACCVSKFGLPRSFSELRNNQEHRQTAIHQPPAYRSPLPPASYDPSSASLPIPPPALPSYEQALHMATLTSKVAAFSHPTTDCTEVANGTKSKCSWGVG